MIWDYHVILIYKPDERCLVFDLDSDLPFPTYFHKYVTETFRTDAILNPEYHRFFRVIPATLFLQTFASDRRHMKKPDGSWMKPPPPYPCIMPPPRNVLNFPAAMIFAKKKHSVPENLKKVQAKKLVKSNKSKFFFREIAFLAVLNFFPVQKLIFGHF